MVLRSGREISLNNKTQLLLIGLTTLLVSGFILGGACYALLLTQLEELKVEMRKIEGTVNQKADVDDLGKCYIVKSCVVFDLMETTPKSHVIVSHLG